MIAVQPAFYAELFGAGVRYTGVRRLPGDRRGTGRLLPLIAAALLAQGGGAPWLVAAWIIVTAVISLVAFLAAQEARTMDINAVHAPQDDLVGAPKADVDVPASRTAR